ncbi:MAG: cyclic nucleotide-binding domain-containing protein [Candidatus Hydrogenedentes bacterium]|nr:cyclic nucleotide-binding domain-containing protein [Candidatus Hydrogenedentota bacterium]
MRWEKKKDKLILTTSGEGNKTPEPENLYKKDKTDYDRSKITSITELLHQIGDIPTESIKSALEEAKETGKFVGEILVEKGIISHDNLLSLLVKQCRIPLLSIISYAIDRSVLKFIPKEVCEKYKILPLDKIGDNITLAMVNPLDQEAIKVAKQHLPGYHIRPILCSYVEFEEVKNRYLREPTPRLEFSYNSEHSEVTLPSNDENLPEAIVVEETFDDKTAEEVKQQNSFIHSVFTEPISSEVSLKLDEVPQKDLSIQELAASMIESLRGSYQLLVRKIKLFNGLTPEEVAHIFNYSKTIKIKKGEELFKKGDPGYSLYILVSGEIEIFDGEKHICYLTPGEMIGEMAVVTKNRRSASARASEDSTLLEVDLNTISRFIPPIVVIKMLTNIIFTLSERLQKITAKIESKIK